MKVFDQDRSSLVYEDVHTLYVSLKGSQIQGRAPLTVSHIQVQQRLHQDLQRVVMPMVSLKDYNGVLKHAKNGKCRDKKKKDIKLTARCRGLTGALTSESFKMSVPEVSISLTDQTHA